ncbi:hypothetical protein GW17_00014405 [Ensete ventricosum]|nr:hypothetical protein GW17_00014405 [Ensete ventricosum]
MLSFHFLQKGAGSDLEGEIDFRGGNVHVITSKESWDQKILEANKDGKIVKVIGRPYLAYGIIFLFFLSLRINISYEHGLYLFQDFSSSWDIHATPTFFFLKDGQQLDKLIGANKPELEKKVIMFVDSSIQCSKGSN